MTRPRLTLALTELAAGGDALGRDDAGRVTFVPRGCPGDTVRVEVARATASYARAELVEVVHASPDRIAPACPAFAAGCGGCAWLHVAPARQVAAKAAIVAAALRGLVSRGLPIAPLAEPAPPVGWRRRARFHVAGGRVGLFAIGSHRLVALAGCPQLEPGLDAARAVIAAARPPDGELHLLRGHQGDVVAHLELRGPRGIPAAWPAAAGLIGQAGLRGITIGDAALGAAEIEVEPGLWSGASGFAQASAAGNAALIAQVRAAVGVPGAGAGRLLELHAGAGNLSRGLLADGWRVDASDVVAPARPVTAAGLSFEVEAAAEVLARRRAACGAPDVVVLDPPRTGAAELIDGLVGLGAPRIVYVSCDVATLARDAGRLVDGGYAARRAWPIDLMPQTAHVEVVMLLERVAG